MIGNAPRINMITVVSMLKEEGVTIRTSTKLAAISSNAVKVSTQDRNEEIPCDSVVLCLGVTPDQDIVDRFINLVPDVYVVGDSATSRGNVWTATSTGFDAAMNI